MLSRCNVRREINIIHARSRANLFRHSSPSVRPSVRPSVFPTTPGVPSNVKEFHPAAYKAAGWPHPFVDRAGCIPDACGRNVSPATVHVERKLYRQLLRGREPCNGAFLPFSSVFLYFFPPCDRRGALRDSTEARIRTSVPVCGTTVLSREVPSPHLSLPVPS